MSKDSRIANAELKLGWRSIELTPFDFQTRFGEFLRAWLKRAATAKRWLLWKEQNPTDKPCYQSRVSSQPIFGTARKVSAPRSYEVDERHKLEASGIGIAYEPGMKIVSSLDLLSYVGWKRYNARRPSYRGFYEFHAHMIGDDVCLHTGDEVLMLKRNAKHLIFP